MTATDEKLLEALCRSTTTTAEAVGWLGVDALALAVEKPSRDDYPPHRRADDPEPKP